MISRSPLTPQCGSRLQCVKNLQIQRGYSWKCQQRIWVLLYAQFEELDVQVIALERLLNTKKPHGQERHVLKS